MVLVEPPLQLEKNATRGAARLESSPSAAIDTSSNSPSSVFPRLRRARLHFPHELLVIFPPSVLLPALSTPFCLSQWLRPPPPWSRTWPQASPRPPGGTNG